MRFSLLFLPLFLLAACGAASPTWMPAGYSYHHDEYKAQPGPQAQTLGYPYNAAHNAYMTALWADVAASLVEDMEAKTGIAPQAVYVQKLPESNAFNLSLDNALRDELRARGYTLAQAADGNIVIRYQAFKAGDEKKRTRILYNGDAEELNKPWNPEKTQVFTFVLILARDGAAFSEIRSQHVLPSYGYVSGEGALVPAPRIMEGEPK